MRILLLILAVVLSGCGHSSTSFEPAQASAVPQSTAVQPRTFQATFDDGTGRATMALHQVGNAVHGTAVVNRGAGPRVMAASGVVNGDRVSLYLVPHAGGSQPLTIAGQVGGAGRWLERNSDVTGGVTLSERAETLAVPSNYVMFVTNGNLVMQLQIQSQAGGIYSGVWNANQPLGFNASEEGTMQWTIADGNVVVALDNGVGELNFPLPSGTNQAPLGSGCHVVVNARGNPTELQNLVGFVLAD